MNYKKVLRGLAIAVSGAVLTYLTEQLPGVNFGAYTGAVVAVASALINAGKLYVQGLK